MGADLEELFLLLYDITSGLEKQPVAACLPANSTDKQHWHAKDCREANIESRPENEQWFPLSLLSPLDRVHFLWWKKLLVNEMPLKCQLYEMLYGKGSCKRRGFTVDLTWLDLNFASSRVSRWLFCFLKSASLFKIWCDRQRPVVFFSNLRWRGWSLKSFFILVGPVSAGFWSLSGHLSAPITL